MSDEPQTVVFVVAGRPQLEGALAVAAHLRQRTVCFDLTTLDIGPLRSTDVWTGRHLPAVTARRVLEARRNLRSYLARGGVLAIVLAQDVGYIERALAAEARRHRVATVLMPDGVVFATTLVEPGLRRRLKDALDVAGRLSRVVIGRHSKMGSTAPDLCMSWGPGWSDAWRTMSPSTEVVVTGSPRADQLQSLGSSEPERVLICSQPLNHPRTGGAATATVWYGWLQRVADTWPADCVRIRLHPAERERADGVLLTSAAIDATSTRPFIEDLAWAGVVSAPASTTLLEAAGAGRRPLLLEVTPALDDQHGWSPFFADERLRRAHISGLVRPQHVLRASSSDDEANGLASDYLSHIGTASERVATAIAERVPR